MDWWQWISAGALLFVLELMFPTGFFLLVVGGAAGVVGLLVLSGIMPSADLQWAVFAGLMVLLWLSFGKRMRRALAAKNSQESTDVVGQLVTIRSAIAPGETGDGELWGAPWRVRNKGVAICSSGDRRKVEAVEGVTLVVGDQQPGER
jgi:membrane protein implicated in regulation of membrane protease activity